MSDERQISFQSVVAEDLEAYKKLSPAAQEALGELAPRVLEILSELAYQVKQIRAMPVVEAITKEQVFTVVKEAVGTGAKLIEMPTRDKNSFRVAIQIMEEQAQKEPRV